MADVNELVRPDDGDGLEVPALVSVAGCLGESECVDAEVVCLGTETV